MIKLWVKEAKPRVGQSGCGKSLRHPDFVLATNAVKPAQSALIPLHAARHPLESSRPSGDLGDLRQSLEIGPADGDVDMEDFSDHL